MKNNKAIKALPLLTILTVALFLRIWGNSFGLPQRTHIDEPAYVLAALKVASGQLHIIYPTLSPNLYQIILAIEYGLSFIFQYLTGRVHTAIEFGNSYRIDPTLFYLLARSTSAIFSTLSILLTYLTGKKLIGSLGGIAAAAWLAISFIDVRHAHFAEPYALVSLLTITSVYFCMRSIEHERGGRYLLLGSILAGAAFALRSTFGLLILIPCLAACLKYHAFTFKRAVLPPLLRSALIIIPGILIGFVGAYPGFVMNPSEFIETIRYYGALAAAAQGFQGLLFNEHTGWAFYLYIFSFGLGIPALILCAVGLLQAVITPEQRLKWLVILLFPALYMILLGSSEMIYTRYTVPLMPFFALSVAAGVYWLYQAIARRSRWAGVTLLLAVGIGLAYTPLKNDILHDRLLTKEDTRSIAKSWIEANIPAGSKIALQWFTPALATEADPEADSKRTYQTTVLDPFTFDRDLYTLDYFRSNGYQYLVVSSFISGLKRVDVAEEAARQSFYAALNTGAELVAEFKPYPGDPTIPYLFEEFYSPVISLPFRDRPGPIIRIYKIRI